MVAASAGLIQSHGSSYDQGENLNGYDFGHGDHNEVDYHSHPKYEFSYGVKDEHTGDDKSQQETRDGDSVKGSYTVVDPDGHKRTVEYSADGHSGFKATVRREPIAGFTGHSGNSGYSGHSEYSGQSGYSDHSGYADQSGYSGQSGYGGYSAGESDYGGHQQYSDASAYQGYEGHQGFEAQSYGGHGSYH